MTITVTTQRYRFSILRDGSDQSGYPIAEDVGTPRKAVEIARHVIGCEPTEVLLAIFLDARHRVTGFAEVARGSANVNRFAPRDVLTPALLANAVAIVIAHNHPSGETSPSRADRLVTVSMKDACALIGIALLDHVIVTDTGHFSFREDGAIDN